MRFTSSKFREMQTREFPHGHNGAAILFLQSLRQVLTALQHRVVEVLDGLIQLTTRKVFHSCGIGPPMSSLNFTLLIFFRAPLILPPLETVHQNGMFTTSLSLSPSHPSRV